jgi:hypothetical protein
MYPVLIKDMPVGEFGSGHVRRRMATAPSKMSWISERARTPSGGPIESALLHTTPQLPASR